MIKEHYNIILTNYIDSDITTSISLLDTGSSSDCPSTCVCAIILVSYRTDGETASVGTPRATGISL